MFTMELTVILENLVWQSDYNGDEVGYEDVGVVGFYMEERWGEERYYYLIDMEKRVLLKFWAENEGE